MRGVVSVKDTLKIYPEEDKMQYNFNDQIQIRREPESFSSTGFAYRAYDRDSGVPLYLGAETLEILIDRLENFAR